MTCGECGNVTAPGAGFPNHVYCKRFLLHMEKREDASRCRYFIPKPITNADRIRNMDDYDLAIFLENVSCKHSDTESWLDWLKEPIEEGE